MNCIPIIISLIIIISILFYLIHQKHLKQYFTVPLSKPTLLLEDGQQLLWFNKNLDNIITNSNTYNIVFKKSDSPFYTNRSIDNDLDVYVGFYFKMATSLSHIKIGLHNTELSELQNPIQDIDFGFHFLPDNKLQILEKYNPYIETDISTKSNLPQDISFCYQQNKKCIGTENTIDISDDTAFAILIDQNMINYVIVKNNPETNKPNSGILIHQSKNEYNYPLYPVVINKDVDNEFEKFRWCNSSHSLGPVDYSVEVLTRLKYDRQEQPEMIDLNRYAPEETPPAPTPAPVFYSWDRIINIKHANLNMRNKVLNIYVEVINISQTFLNNLYGVNILLSVPESKKNKKLVIPYIPLLSPNNLKIKENNIVEMSVNIAAHLNYFYQKNIKLQVVLRLGEFTSYDNLLSDSFILNF